MTATIPPGAQKLLTYDAYIEEMLTQPPTRQPCEILDGVRHMPPSPRPLHQIILDNLLDLLHDARRAGAQIRTLSSPLDLLIRRDPLRVREPDLFVMTTARYIDNRVSDMPGPITVSPELVVEVLSPSESRRSVDSKIADFQAIGVQECWIVSPEAETVEVLALSQTEVRTDAVYSPGSELRSITFTDIVLNVEAIFDRQ